MKDGKFLTMGIETSCDETSIAIVANGREVLSNIISSQIDIFKNYGGVVPEIASRRHLENINSVMEEALVKADVGISDIDLIACTYGPGLVGALLVGLSHAKAVAFSKDIPLVGVHHLLGHISANFIEHPELEPPFMSLITSGGHTEIVDVKTYTDCEVLGGTRDDAIGEAYDKVARVLELGYPGGPKIDKLAKEGNKDAIHFKRVFLEKEDYEFSFSGLKTAVLNYINSEKIKGNEIDRADIAASFQAAAIEVIVFKAIEACKVRNEKRLVLSGGVAANSYLRSELKKACDENEIELFVPSPILCTDNGAMIACAGYYTYMEKGASSLDLDCYPNLAL